MTGRCHYHRHNGHNLPPARRALTGPNQRWYWDISCLLTYERGIFLYLYLLLDEYARKALAWRISWQQTMQEARELMDRIVTQRQEQKLAQCRRRREVNLNNIGLALKAIEIDK